jgi:AcrR family transcriptional regulator
MAPSRPPAGAAVLQESTTAAIADAAFAELADSGWRGLTVDRVAARAGVGKAAVYRRWPSRDAMLLDLIEQVGARSVLPPDTGSLRADLEAFVTEALKALARPQVARIAADVLAEGRRSPPLARAIAQRFRDPRRRAMRTVLERGQRRGELPAGADLELGLDLLTGPIMLSVIGRAGRRPRDYAPRLVDAVLRALGG